MASQEPYSAVRQEVRYHINSLLAGHYLEDLADLAHQLASCVSEEELNTVLPACRICHDRRPAGEMIDDICGSCYDMTHPRELIDDGPVDDSIEADCGHRLSAEMGDLPYCEECGKCIERCCECPGRCYFSRLWYEECECCCPTGGVNADVKNLSSEDMADQLPRDDATFWSRLGVQITRAWSIGSRYGCGVISLLAIRRNRLT
jgi:hypothetical protein